MLKISKVSSPAIENNKASNDKVEHVYLQLLDSSAFNTNGNVTLQRFYLLHQQHWWPQAVCNELAVASVELCRPGPPYRQHSGAIKGAGWESRYSEIKLSDQ